MFFVFPLDMQVKVDAKTKTYLDEYKAEKKKEMKKVTHGKFVQYGVKDNKLLLSEILAYVELRNNSCTKHWDMFFFVILKSKDRKLMYSKCPAFL